MDEHRSRLGINADEAASDEISIYIVREGDTIRDVAKMFNVSENTIRWANNLDSKPTLKKDQELIILPITGVKYTVKKGDTVKSIATSFKGDVNEILSYNALSDDSPLIAGEEIIIPNGEVVAIPKVAQIVPKIAKTTPLIGGKSIAIKDDTGYFSRPVRGGIKTQGLHGHNGIDIASSLNTPIIAAADGIVLISRGSGWNGGYGDYVVIKHPNGMQTLYGHMNSVLARQGSTVSKGTIIGYMGNTGDSSGIHLHFEVRGGVNPF